MHDVREQEAAASPMTRRGIFFISPSGPGSKKATGTTHPVSFLKIPRNFPSLNLAFTFAVQDLKSLWRWYRYGYEKELTE